MSDLPSNSFAKPPAQPTAATAEGNRLSIAHLLLWITTTAAVFGFLQRHSPESSPPVSSGDARLDQIREQVREVERWEFISMLTFAPAYGVTLAGVILAAWRVATRRFGFPTQPGHWLLLLLAIIPAMAMVISLFESASPGSHRNRNGIALLHGRGRWRRSANPPAGAMALGFHSAVRRARVTGASDWAECALAG